MQSIRVVTTVPKGFRVVVKHLSDGTVEVTLEPI